MGFDRNTIIGFVLIGVLMVGMLWFNSRDSQAYQKEQKRINDSTALANKGKIDTNAVRNDSVRNAELHKAEILKGLPPQVINTPEQLTEVQNEVLKITFTNKGGQPKIVELKKFLTHDGKPVVLQNGVDNKISYPVLIGGTTKETSEINFPVINKTVSGTDQIISFSLNDSTGKSIEHRYTIHQNDYMIDFDIKMQGTWISQNLLRMQWQTIAPQAENSAAYENQQSSVNYVEDGNFDFTRIGTGNDKKFDKPVDWLALKQQFFLSLFGAKNKFQSADITWKVPADSLKTVALATANFKLPVAPEMQLELFYGPSDYNILKKYNNHMEQIVPYGSGIFSFVKYINRYFLLPVWDFLRSNIPSYGMVILLLTLLIRLLTSPILYKSYVSGAKMKVLKPEIDALKAKYKDDQQAFSMEQMKLWKTAGVSPLGGCLPALLQIPIFMSLFYFFQANISLRGQSFLWAKDLAAYDSIAKLPFNIPFYGDHVSLFTLTAVATSLLISIYSMSNMQDNSNPLMKYMPYIFPVLLLGVFNKLPAALTWYYTVSNTITLILQIVIQKYIINHDKLKAQIEENKKRPVKQSKLAERMQAMQEANKKMQEQKNKNNQGKR
ncbi:MAG: membrane protein insertase YidC [Ferruginibacter sp.]